MLTTENMNISNSLEGFIKIWQTDPKSGEIKLLVDKRNLILKGGAKIIASALGGNVDSKIWGMYIGYSNDPNFDLVTDAPAIDVDYSNRFINFESPLGFLREQLTFSPTYMSTAGYESNTVLFSTMITSATSAGGAEFNTDSQIYEVALISAADPTAALYDTVFSRTNFNPVQYNSNYNFTITWGIRILVPSA
jgi:hypothetical protein